MLLALLVAADVVVTAVDVLAAAEPVEATEVAAVLLAAAVVVVGGPAKVPQVGSRSLVLWKPSTAVPKVTSKVVVKVMAGLIT